MLSVIVGLVVGVLVGRWWVLVLVLATPALALVGGGSYYADSGPRWVVALLFVGLPLAVGLIAGVALRARSRSAAARP